MRILITLIFAMIPAGPAVAGLITINSTSVRSDTRLGFTTFSGTDIPTHEVLAAGSGSNTSNTTIDFSDSAGEAIINFDFDHNRLGSFGDNPDQRLWASSTATIFITANENATVALNGDYRLLGFNFDESVIATGSIGFGVLMQDLTVSSALFFDNRQRSFFDDPPMENESFVLGETGGNVSNDLRGSFPVNLIAGHEYRLQFDAFITNRNAQDVLFLDDGASALGSVNLTINGAEVPEPTSLALLGMGGLSLFGYGWRRRKRASFA